MTWSWRPRSRPPSPWPGSCLNSPTSPAAPAAGRRTAPRDLLSRPAAAPDGLHEQVPHGHQPLVGGAGPHAAGGLGLPLRQVAGLQDLARRSGRTPPCTGARGRRSPGLSTDSWRRTAPPPGPRGPRTRAGAWGTFHRLDPGEQMVPVRVGGEALEVHDLRVDGDLLAEELHAARTPSSRLTGPGCPPPGSPRTPRCTPAARGCA